MSDYGRLAFTGVPTIAIFGLVIDQWWIAGGAAALVLLGILGLRVFFRRGREVGQR